MRKSTKDEILTLGSDKISENPDSPDTVIAHTHTHELSREMWGRMESVPGDYARTNEGCSVRNSRLVMTPP
jgi:hypothetical protein